ncbi:hypothetical protein D3P08_13990 [Paenibacillus nanensis]|uniref:Uncharacterized protein n=1 Tax=Paenibacillus nanensis TaxID=393251 RepID=A0A3A1UV50_9BACL|nr:hypothetical protein [Paenibacillus nanensis]RIX52085.1 hypothetical protein D3P08_13990 [Paenibacillus nanensis]
MKKRRQMVMVTPGKDVTLYIPTDTPPEVIAYLNRLKAEGFFSQGIMEILTLHILRKGASEASPYPDLDEASASWDDALIESITESVEAPEPVAVAITEQEINKPFSLEDIIKQATRNAGKLLQERQPNE